MMLLGVGREICGGFYVHFLGSFQGGEILGNIGFLKLAFIVDLEKGVAGGRFEEDQHGVCVCVVCDDTSTGFTHANNTKGR
jgi:hypothetical protein